MHKCIYFFKKYTLIKDLPLFRLLPEFLNDLGYKSMAVGKWHLGSHSANFTPTYRGFKSHLGYWTGHEDYYDHTAQELYGPVVSTILSKLIKKNFCENQKDESHK